MPMQMISHDEKSHIAPHFNHLGLRNVMLPLMIPSASCGADSDTNGVT